MVSSTRSPTGVFLLPALVLSDFGRLVADNAAGGIFAECQPDLGQGAQREILAPRNFQGGQLGGHGVVHGHEAGKICVPAALAAHGFERPGQPPRSTAQAGRGGYGGRKGLVGVGYGTGRKRRLSSSVGR